MASPSDPGLDLWADVDDRLSVSNLFDEVGDLVDLDTSLSSSPQSLGKVPPRHVLSPGLEDIDLFSGLSSDDPSAEIWGILKAQTGRLQAHTGRLQSLESQVSFLKDEFSSLSLDRDLSFSDDLSSSSSSSILSNEVSTTSSSTSIPTSPESSLTFVVSGSPSASPRVPPSNRSRALPGLASIQQLISSVKTSSAEQGPASQPHPSPSALDPT
ncbi:MAG: hypothetical protein Q8P67_01720, partial [archaeon]|nr:hypothetical protein [archaeon]